MAPSIHLTNPALMGVITFIIVIVIIILWASMATTTINKRPASVMANVPTPLTIDDPIGASSNGIYTLHDDGDSFTDSASCKMASNTQWSHLRCTCTVPFFGSSCTRESYSNGYQAIGNPSSDDITINVIDTPVVDALSFPVDDITCTGLCDDDELCTGVIFQSTCTLLSGDVIVSPNIIIPYSMEIDSTLYLKGDDRHLIFTDRVFIYTGTLPARYYLRTTVSSDAGGQMFPAIENIITKLTFFPIKQLNTANLIGIYSENELTQNMINQISQGMMIERVIIVQPNVVDLPDFSQFKELWVAYIAQI